MTGLFENDNERYLVLINEEGQHSLWPVRLQVPPGWTTAYGPSSRQSCLEFVETNWTDMRPKSLVAALQSQVDAPNV